MNEINLYVPRNYSEMTEKQLRYVAALLIHGTDEEVIWTKCFVRFSGIKAKGGSEDFYFFSKKNIPGIFALSIDEVNYFSKKMAFLTSSYSGIKPLQKIGKYDACDELLRDTSFVQYLEAENYYQAFLHTKDDNFLYLLMSTLYQKGKKYDNNITETRSKYFRSHTSEVDKMIIAMWMIGIKEYFSKKFNHLFGRLDVDPVGDTFAPDMYAIIQNQVRILTDGDITKREKVLSANTWDALDEMNAKIRESKEIQIQKQYKC